MIEWTTLRVHVINWEFYLHFKFNNESKDFEISPLAPIYWLMNGTTLNPIKKPKRSKAKLEFTLKFNLWFDDAPHQPHTWC